MGMIFGGWEKEREEEELARKKAELRKTLGSLMDDISAERSELETSNWDRPSMGGFGDD